MSEWRQISEIADTNPESLGAGTDPDYRFSYIDLGSVEEGDVHWDSLQEFRFIEAPGRARRKVRPGDVLFGTVRPNLRSHGYVSERQSRELVASTGFSVIRARDGISDGKYLSFAVLGREIYTQSINTAVGSNYPAVNDRDVREFRVFAPPVHEQRKIAQVLDTLDTQIRQTEALISKLERIKQGLLTDLLTRGIDQNGQLRPPPEEAPDLYKDSLLGPVPCDWRVVRSIEAVEVKNPNRRVDETSCSSGGKTPILNQSKSGFLGWTDLSPDISASRNEPYVTFANHTCAVRWVDFDCCAIQNVFFLRGATETSTRFLYYALDGRIPQQSYQGHWPLLKESYLCLPSFTEQRRIAKSLDSLHGRSKTERNKLRELKAIRAGLMDDLLTGRVRVTPLLETTERATV